MLHRRGRLRRVPRRCPGGHRRISVGLTGFPPPMLRGDGGRNEGVWLASDRVSQFGPVFTRGHDSPNDGNQNGRNADALIATAKRLVKEVENGKRNQTSIAASKSLATSIGRSDALSIRLTVQAGSLATQPLSSSAQPEGHPQVWAQEVLIAMSEQSGLTQEDDAATWFVRTVYGPNTNKKTTPYVPRPVGRGTTVGKARGRAGIETDMLEETGWRDRNQTATAASAAASASASASASRNDDAGRMVEIHLILIQIRVNFFHG